LVKLPESLDIETDKSLDKGIFIGLSDVFKNIIRVLRFPVISTLVLTNFLFIMGFSMIHGIFILFTAMDPENGGLGFDVMENGWVFAYIGLLGVIVQGGLIGKITKLFDLRKLMIFGTVSCGIGIASIPYVPSHMSWLIFISSSFIAIGNGLFSPTQSSLLTFESSKRGYELGMVMGAQEGYGALARIFGPLLAAYLWSLTVEGDGFWTYHTSFRVAGLIFIIAVILQFKLQKNLKMSISLTEED
jgi:DHA1 family tetracycline resistance protein-like MFS transporter